ncbi:hypothetical protein ACTA71_011375 [Dictyostelium dimigraforme]
MVSPMSNVMNGLAIPMNQVTMNNGIPSTSPIVQQFGIKDYHTIAKFVQTRIHHQVRTHKVESAISTSSTKVSTPQQQLLIVGTTHQVIKINQMLLHHQL